jgi:hypothetical protein
MAKKQFISHRFQPKDFSNPTGAKALGPPRGFVLSSKPEPQPLPCAERTLSLTVDLAIHCKTIRARCNAIQTLLQLNSNNYTRVRCRILLHLAGDGGKWQDGKGFIAAEHAPKLDRFVRHRFAMLRAQALVTD